MFFQGLSDTVFFSYKHHIFVTKKFRSSRPEVFCKKDVCRNFAKFTGKLLCQSLFLIKLQASGLQFIKETLAHDFSCEFHEISKNTSSYRTSPVAASEKL